METPIDSPYTATLQDIDRLIQRGDERAEAELRAFPSVALEQPHMREAIATLWNNLGVVQARARGAAAGLDAFRKAISLNPVDRTANLNVTQAFWEVKDPALTRDHLEKLIGLAPDHPLPHLLLADLLYDRDDLVGAAQHYDEAKRYASQDPGSQALIEMLSAKLKRLERAERGFSARASEHFKVKFDGGENYEVWDRVLAILEEAYRDIGQQLGHFPGKPILVILHTRETFHAATGGPAWADGLFDPIEGRIKVPTQGALTEQGWLTSVLRHEYVHALLHDRMGGRVGAIPTWLNEGLAMQLSNNPLPDLPQLIRGQITLINLSLLEGGWGNLPANAAQVAYVEGNSATRFLIDRFGMERVRNVLETMATGQPFAAAFESRVFISYAEFQRRWVDDVNARL